MRKGPKVLPHADKAGALRAEKNPEPSGWLSEVQGRCVGEGELAQPFPLGPTESHAPDPDTFPSPQRLWGFTCRTRPERGSITRSFLSLHVVVSRLPSVLKDMQRITSEWQSIIFTGSPTSRFQMRTCQGRVGRVGPAAEPRAVCPPSAPDGPGRDAPCRVGLCWEAGRGVKLCIKG